MKKANIRSKIIGVRVTDDEYRIILSRALKAKINPAGYIYKLVDREVNRSR